MLLDHNDVKPNTSPIRDERTAVTPASPNHSATSDARHSSCADEDDLLERYQAVGGNTGVVDDV